MAQEISPISNPEFVEARIRQFIFFDTDGSWRVDVSNMQAFLAEQFGYLTAAGVSPAAKMQQAGQIAATMQSVIGRENWKGNANYPTSDGAGSTAVAVRAQLNEIRGKTTALVNELQANYQPFYVGLPSKIKALFNTMVLPGFPEGVQIKESSRAYIETFVTDWGEESAPSPASGILTMDQNDTATYTGGVPPAGRFITKRRVYRSATGTTQSAWRLQGEYDAAQATIVDSKTDAELNDVCVTFGWLEPPADLRGLTGMANGYMIGFVGRTLYCCEPYAPYAYPAKYDKPMPHNVVGIASMGQSALVATTSYPYIVTGADPASLTDEKLADLIPCASARSMVAIGGSVFYASPDGLALYENGRVNIVTTGIDRKKWQSYYPETMCAAGFDGRYVVFYQRPDYTRGGLVFDYQNRSMAELDQSADAVYSDKSGLFVLLGTKMFDVFPGGDTPRTSRFYSKTFRLPKVDSFAWIHVDSEFKSGPVTLRIYADKDNGLGMQLHYSVVVASNKPVRHKPGLARDWRIEIESASTVNGVVLATTTEELQAVQ